MLGNPSQLSKQIFIRFAFKSEKKFPIPVKGTFQITTKHITGDLKYLKTEEYFC